MDIRHLSFRLLQVYIRVVQAGSISAAARSLHLTQPTVSLQIKKLTELVGEPLLENRDGRLLPTAIGAELHRTAADAVGRFADFNDTLRQARSGQWGRLSIGLVTTAKYVIPPILGAFCRQSPKVDLALNIGNRARILKRFAAQEDDLYLFSYPPSGQHVRAAAIIRNPLQLIAPRDHWAARESQLDFARLAGERFLIREPGSATRKTFETWLSARGHELHNTLQIESNEAIRLSVASGMGLAVLSAHTLEEGRERFVCLPVAGFPLESSWYLVSRRDYRLSQAALSLVQFIARELNTCIDPQWLLPGTHKLAGFGEEGGSEQKT